MRRLRRAHARHRRQFVSAAADFERRRRFLMIGAPPMPL